MNPRLKVTDLPLRLLKDRLSSEFISQLKKVYLCGNYGDPIMAAECLPILRFFRETNPELQIGIHTNGGARDKAFWQELASIVDYCRFGIDGLEKTNHLYRQGVQWDRLTENIRTYIGAGGRAEWDFLVFKHNQHETASAEMLSKELGFKAFHLKSTSRFFSTHKQKLDTDFQVFNIDGSPSHLLQKTTSDAHHNAYYSEQESIISKHGSLDQYWGKCKISCKAQRERSLYISAEGLVFPCCWVGNETASAAAAQSNEFWLHRRLSYLGMNMQAFSLVNKELEDIVVGAGFETIERSWEVNGLNQGRLKTCARTCGSDLDPFSNQFL